VALTTPCGIHGPTDGSASGTALDQPPHWISSADLDVGEVRFWCTLATAPQDQRGTDEHGHH
jgi:hypothetical protein